MEILLLAGLLFAVAALFFVTGRLIEQGRWMQDLRRGLDESRAAEHRAINQLMLRAGADPVYAISTATTAEQRDDDNADPIDQTILPPFAQAELDWEREEQDRKKQPTLTETIGAIVPPLSDEQIAQIDARRNNNHG